MKVPKSKLWKLLPVALLSLLFFPSVLADFTDGFDSYPVNTLSPGPWLQQTSMGSCFTGTKVDAYSPSTLMFTPPNVYQFQGLSTAGCFTGGGQDISITALVNATSPTITISFEFRVYAPTSVNGTSGGFTFSIYVCGSVVGGPIPLDHTTSYWEHFAFSGPPTAGCRVGFNLQTTATPGTVIFWIDSVAITGADVVTPGANLFLVDYATQQLFNISDYSGSSLRINYDLTTNCAHWDMVQASPNVCLLNNLQVPDLNVSLSGAVLITVNVGGSVPYTRTIIPQPNLLHTGSSPTETMYLDFPTPCPGICSYTLTVNDFTGFYPTGTTEGFITQGNFTMTSALLDAQSAIAMTMVPGLYNLTLISAGGLHTYSSPLTLTATDSAPQVLIQNGSSPITIGPFQQFSYSASWDCNLGGITSTIQDSLGTMTTEVFQLYRYNSSDPGGVVVASHTSHVSGAPGFTVSYDFTNSTYGVRNINSSTPNEYKVAYTLTVPSGMENFGQFAVGTSSSCPNLPNGAGLGSGFVLPTAVLGLDAVFAPANAYEFIFSIIIVIMTVGIMGARMAHVSMLVMGGEVGILSVLHWLPLAAVPLAGIFLFIGALGVLSNRARRPIT